MFAVTVLSGSGNGLGTNGNINRTDTETARRIDNFVNGQTEGVTEDIWFFVALVFISGALTALYFYSRKEATGNTSPERAAPGSVEMTLEGLRNVLGHRYGIDTKNLTVGEIIPYEKDEDLKKKLQELTGLLQAKELGNKNVDENKIRELFPLFL